MKVLYTITLFIFLQISVSAQVKTSIELLSGIHDSYRFLFSSNDNSLSEAIVSSKNIGEVPSLLYRLGLNYNQLFKRNLFFKTGLVYSTLGYHEKEHVIFPIECLTGVDIFNLEKASITQKFTFLEIPVIMRREFGTQKITPYLEFGLSPSVFLNRKFTYLYEDGTTRIEKSMNVIGESRLNLFSSFSFGLNYNINNNYQLFSQLSYRLNLAPFTRFESYEFLYSGGIEMGIRRRVQFWLDFLNNLI